MNNTDIIFDVIDETLVPPRFGFEAARNYTLLQKLPKFIDYLCRSYMQYLRFCNPNLQQN